MYFRIVPRTAHLDVTLHHQQPCLLNELYLVQMEITNEEEHDIFDIR